jgi:hypothetical protein
MLFLASILWLMSSPSQSPLSQRTFQTFRFRPDQIRSVRKNGADCIFQVSVRRAQAITINSVRCHAECFAERDVLFVRILSTRGCYGPATIMIYAILTLHGERERLQMVWVSGVDCPSKRGPLGLDRDCCPNSDRVAECAAPTVDPPNLD